MKMVRFGLATAISTLLCISLSAGCSAFGSGPTTPVMLASGSTDGVSWHVWAWEEGGSLCMSTGTAAGPDGGTITPSAHAMTGGGCGFNRDYPDSTYYVGADGGGTGSGQFTASLTFGPLPAQATQIKVTSKLTLTAKSFPAGKGLPTGRFWVWADSYQPAASEGSVLATPQPLDSAGKPVAFQNF